MAMMIMIIVVIIIMPMPMPMPMMMISDDDGDSDGDGDGDGVFTGCTELDLYIEWNLNGFSGPPTTMMDEQIFDFTL